MYHHKLLKKETDREVQLI